MNNEISLYIHIPFCVRKCLYCDFLSFAADDAAKEAYLDALDREAEALLPVFEGKKLVSVFIGGGTPTSLNEEQLKRLTEIVRRVTEKACTDKACTDNEHTDRAYTKNVCRENTCAENASFEYTVECNPGTVNAEKMKILREGGVNRISFGLQTMDSTELKALGRIHSYEDFLESLSYAREAGFTNISADLISSIPYQTEESFEKTLRSVAGLGLTHISAYSLIVEEGTPFYEKYTPGEYPLPDEETERNIYYRTREILSEYGYERYEISNYAKPGFESLHNCGYWTGREYLGLGLGAASFLKREPCVAKAASFPKQEPFAEKAASAGITGACFGAVRYKNTTVMENYFGNPVCNYEEKEELSGEELMAEFMILGLRMTKGVSESEFEARFAKKLKSVYGSVLDKQMRRGLIAYSDGRYFLTERGTDISNSVMCEFLP